MGEAATAGYIRNARKWNAEQLLTAFVKVDLTTLRVDAVVAKAEFVAQVRLEKVCPAGCEAAIRVILYASKESTAIAACAVEGAGDNAGLIFVAETEEAIVFVSVFLIYANVEVVPGFAANWIRQEIETISINR